MSKRYVAQDKETGKYLMSPRHLADLEWWDWSRKIEDAHHFDSRADAKTKLRELCVSSRRSFKAHAYSYHPVKA